MNDRFKFRAWNTVNGKMYHNTYIEPLVIGDNNCWAIKGFADDTGSILMQSTGLRDKEGTLIFEGDIVRMTNDDYDPTDKGLFVGLAQVVSREPESGFNIRYITEPSDECDSHSMWHLGEDGTTEVVGNIFENPELLEE